MNEITMAKCQMCGNYYPADHKHKCDGRAKKYIVKEDGSIHHLDKDIEDAYNRGRREAIDEFNALLKEHPMTSNFDWDYYDEIAEEMKEDKNE